MAEREDEATRGEDATGADQLGAEAAGMPVAALPDASPTAATPPPDDDFHLGTPPPPIPPAAAPRSRRPRRPLWRRTVRALSLSLGALLTLAVAGGVFLVHSAFSGQNLPVLRAMVGAVGRVVAGQRTERLDLQVRVRTDAREISGVARLQVRVAEPRGQLYFVLNDGLRIHRAWSELPNGRQVDVPVYRIWLFAILQLPQALAADDQARIGIEFAGRPARERFGIGTGFIEPDDVMLSAFDFWYPTDLQSFAAADVTVTVPAHLTVVHNGEEKAREVRGDVVQVRWTSPRPVAALALVAGRYREASRLGERRYRVFLSPDADLDAERLLDGMAAADRVLTARYGAAGFPHVTLVVNRALDRAFNDGSGLLAIPPRYIRRGDYGFATIAHEIAHNWWGATVAERWLEPGTGGEWIVEGMAEFSSLVAVQDHLGQAALVETLRGEFYDPAATGVLAAMSALDNGLDPTARATIYHKGAYVTYMLARQMGDEAFFGAARELLDAFRHQQVSARDFESLLVARGGADIAAFLQVWVRSDAFLDLALDPQDGNAVVRNHATAPPPAELSAWHFPASGEPERETVALDATVTLGAASRLVLDPLLAVADMYRDNNVFPRWPNPRAVGRSMRGELLVAYGEPYAWSPARLSQIAANGRVIHSWDFDRGIAGEPSWSTDGTRILVLEKDRKDKMVAVALNASDGSRQTIGPATAAVAAADWIALARGDRLVRLEGGRETVLVRHPRGEIRAPLGAPDGAQIAYAVQRAREMDLRVMDADGANDRLLVTWQVGPVRWEWSPDGTRLFAILPGDWDWHLWEIPVVPGQAPRVVVTEAASIAGLAVAPDGRRLAFAAAPTLEYGAEHREVFVVDHTSAEVRQLRFDDADIHRLAWLDEGSLLVVASNPATPAVPEQRELRRLDVVTETLQAFP